MLLFLLFLSRGALQFSHCYSCAVQISADLPNPQSMAFQKYRIAAAFLLCMEPAAAFLSIQSHHGVRPVTFVRMADIISPFDDSSAADGKGGPNTSTTKTATEADKGPLELTWENVELVLDSMRSYLIQDGGNVIISEIDGPVVRLELQVGLLSS